jgi:hypothetical protein
LGRLNLDPARKRRLAVPAFFHAPVSESWIASSFALRLRRTQWSLALLAMTALIPNAKISRGAMRPRR